jgi:hypothetical protein
VAGRYAIVVAERPARLDFRSPTTSRSAARCTCRAGASTTWTSPDGSYLLASCEFSGQLVNVDLSPIKVASVLDLPDAATAMRRT